MKVKKNFVRLDFENAENAKKFADSVQMLQKGLYRIFQQHYSPEQVLANTLAGAFKELNLMQQAAQQAKSPQPQEDAPQ